MAGKKKLILTLAPFVLFIILGTVFIGTYYRETALAREQLAAIDELEEFGGQRVPSAGFCNHVAVYVMVNRRGDAERVMSMLRELNITVRVHRSGKRHLSMTGAVRLDNVKMLQRMSEENGWPAFYSNHSDICLEYISRLRRENKIIVEHLDNLSPESRQVLLSVLEDNKRAIEGINQSITEWAEVDILVSTGGSYTPRDFHELSSFLTTWGVIFAVAFLTWNLFKRK